MVNERISDKLAIPSHYVEVNGSKIHYLEKGQGNPILFLHGIPMSSYVWRNIIPHLAPLGRCIAPDLIGFGRSDHPDINYSISDHIRYIEQFIEALGLKKITLVMHGWGSVVGFNYAMHHEKNCRGLVFYEAFLRSSAIDEVSLPYEEQVNMLQEESDTVDATMNGASFVDTMLTQNAIRQLSDEEMTYYREPFLRPGSAKPILQYIKELPTDNSGKKNEIAALISDYTTKLTRSKLPKLMLYSVPGFVMTIATIMWAKEHLPNLEIVDIGEELHLAQESYPDLMGETISVWLQGVESTSG